MSLSITETQSFGLHLVHRLDLKAIWPWFLIKQAQNKPELCSQSRQIGQNRKEGAEFNQKTLVLNLAKNME